MAKLAVTTAPALAAAVTAAMLSQPVAHADALSDVTGKYYGQAKQVLSNAGLTPIVATRVGDQATDDNCVIDRIENADFVNGTGKAAGKTVYVYLNCYANVASPQQAGYSRQSQLGKAAYDAQQQAAAQQQAESEQAITAENQR